MTLLVWENIMDPKKITNSAFAKNFIIISSGNIVNQIVLLISYPIISRLFQPNDFGIFAQFQAILSIILLISSLRYESAIIIAKDDEEAVNLLFLCFTILITIVLFVFCCVVIFGNNIANAFSNIKLKFWLYLLPLFLLLAGSQEILNYWAIKRKNFKNSNYSNILKSSTNSLTRIIMGALNLSNVGLFVSRGISYLFSLVILVLKESNYIIALFLHNKVQIKKISLCAKKYRNFPLFMSWGVILNNLSINIILLIISKFFGITMLGYYALANTTLNIPISIFRKTINTVFFQKASERKNIGAPIINDLKKITLYLGVIGIIPLIVLVLFAPQIYSFILGENWLLTGKMVSIISPWLFLTLVTTPATSLIPVFGLQKYFVFLQLGVFLTRTLALLLGYLIFNELLQVIILLSFHGVIVNIFNLLYIFFKIKRIEENEKIKFYE